MGPNFACCKKGWSNLRPDIAKSLHAWYAYIATLQTLWNIWQSMTRSPFPICWLIERSGLDSLCTKLKFTFHEKSRKEGEGREMEKYIVISNVWGWWRLEEIKNGRPILNIYTFSSAGEKRTASKNVQTVPDRIDERETRRSAGSEC